MTFLFFLKYALTQERVPPPSVLGNAVCTGLPNPTLPTPNDKKKYVELEATGKFDCQRRKFNGLSMSINGMGTNGSICEPQMIDKLNNSGEFKCIYKGIIPDRKVGASFGAFNLRCTRSLLVQEESSASFDFDCQWQ